MHSPLKEQIIASHPRKNIWVSANAGTGKTFILVNRFIRLILDGNEPHRIVCITYTKAAAAEMQERIISELSELVLLSDAELKQKLDNQYNENFDLKKLARNKVKLANILDFPEQLKIQTIHSFCQSVLKSFPLEAGIPPFFNVIDDIAANELIDESWNRLITEDEDNTALGFLLARFQLFGIKNIFKALVSEREKIFTAVNSKGGLDGYVNYLKEKMEIESDDVLALEEKLNNDVAEFIAQLAPVLAKGKKTETAILEDLNIYLKTKNIEDLESIFFTDKGDLRQYYLKTLVKDYPILAANAMDYADEVEYVITKKRDIELFNITKNILILFTQFYTVFENSKKLKYLLDYDDLILKTAELLDKNNANSQWVLYKLDGGVDHILLDEAQDTNPNQWKVIDAITAEFFSHAREKSRSLFVVGDEKQSIYSFQGADVNVFNKKREQFEKVKVENSEIEMETIALNKSFRSTRAVLDVVDKVLALEKIRAAVTHGDISTHALNRNEGFGYFEVNELCGNDIKASYDNDQITWKLPREYITEDELKNKEILANKVVARIDEILNRDYALAHTGKRPTAGDIMILLKKRDELSDLLIRKLQQKNIPVSGIDRLKLNENLAIKDLIALGKFILLENDDLNFAALSKSPIFEASEEQLFNICWNRGDKSVYEALIDKDSGLFTKVEKLKDELKNCPVYEFYFRAVEVLGLRQNFISYFGTQINEILDEFLNVVKNYETQNGHALQGFIGWFGKNEMEVKRNLHNKEGEVRLLTVHGAKGLEAPIVIIPDTTSVSRSYSQFGFDGDMFLCPLLSDYKNEAFEKIEVAEKLREENEYYRLLYVALTRARDEMYVFGYKAKRSQTETWHNVIWTKALEICEKQEGRLVYTDVKYVGNKVGAEKNEDKKVVELNFGKYEKAKEIEVVSPSNLYGGSKEKLAAKNVDFTKGLAVHKLLEILPEVESVKRAEFAAILFRNFPELSEDEQKNILNEAVGVMDNKEFEFIFSARSKAEVPICGMIDGKYISGKIDRLIESENEVLVVDYKTNRAKDVAEVSERYRAQMDAYKKLLEKIYVNKKVRTALLFTAVNKLNYLN